MSALSVGRVTAGVALVIAWVLLQGELSVLNVIAGALVTVAIGALIGAPDGEHAAKYRPHPVGIFRFVATVLWSLVTSSVQVIIATLAPTPQRTAGAFVDARLTNASPASLVLVANAISVTPGTITVEAELGPNGDATLVVHVFGSVDPQDFQADIDQLHRLALGAISEVRP